MLNISPMEPHLILITLPGKTGTIITITQMKTYSFAHQVFTECLLGAKAVLGTGNVMVPNGYADCTLTVDRRPCEGVGNVFIPSNPQNNPVRECLFSILFAGEETEVQRG